MTTESLPELICATTRRIPAVRAADVLCRAAVETYFVHRYFVPGLEFGEVVLTALERRYGITIHRYPTPRVKLMVDSDTLRIGKVWDVAYSPQYTRPPAAWDRWIAEQAGTPWMTTGIRATDSMIRRHTMKRHGNPNVKLKRFYPLQDWTQKEVFEHIEREKLPLSPIYKVMGRSLDTMGLTVYPLREHFPRDYKRIIAVFPLIDVLVRLYDARKQADPNLPHWSKL
jgi:hypothetical protein